jgi:DNA-binding transcriptional MerR regulator
VSAPSIHTTDPLGTLRQYAALAPWSLRDLSSLAGAILEASATFPVNATARQLPTERTIRFYVTRKLVSPPEGRGTAATYGYRHLLQVLAIKLQQMEGATLETLGREFAATPGDVLSDGSPRPWARDCLSRPASLAAVAAAPRARSVGRFTPGSAAPPREPTTTRPRTWRRILLGRGAELLVDDEHPLFDGGDEAKLQALFQRILSDAIDGRPSPSSR